MTDYERIERVIRYIDQTHADQPDLKKLARIAGLSESHFHRLFVKWAGTTPKSFIRFLTAAHARRLLNDSKDLLSVSLEAGLSGPGRLHDLMVSIEAMSPGEVKAKGAGIEIRYGFHETVFGEALIALTPRGLCHLEFVCEGRRKAFTDLKEKWVLAKFVEDARATAKVDQAVFETRRGEVKIHLHGTEFQIKVWQALLEIPEGRLISYSRLAKAIGAPRAARAVGSAIGSNPIAYLIPCHRVIRETGGIGGYKWGRHRKQAILARENANR